MSHRTQITLEDEQYERLMDLSRRSGLGMAELIRQAVDKAYGSRRSEALLTALSTSFGAWSSPRDNDSDDGAAFVEHLRPGMAARLDR